MAIPIQNQKNEVFSRIAALKVLADDSTNQTQELWESLQTITKDPISFLSDLIKELIGYEALRDGFINAMGPTLNFAEEKIKYSIKLKLKELLSCGVNPEIPNDFKYSSGGYNFKLSQLDFANIFRLEPSSRYGSFIYRDVSAELDSNDLNTVLYNTIQDDGTEHQWGEQMGYNDITTFRFDSSNGENINVLNVRASEYYSNNKTLTDWNDDYIDSIDFFPEPQFYGKILDTIFNSFSNVITKTPNQCETEEKLNRLVDKLLDTEPDEYIDDSFFSFNNVELREISEKSKLKSLGVTKLKTCTVYANKIDSNDILNAINNIENSATLEDKRNTLENSTNHFGELAGDIADTENKYNVKLNFFSELIRAITKSMVSTLFSPKILTSFLVNYKITQGNNAEFDSIEELMKLLKNLIKEIIDIIKGVIISSLLEIAMKEIKSLQSQVTSKILRELASNELKVLLSLTGVPQDIIRLATKF